MKKHTLLDDSLLKAATSISSNVFLIDGKLINDKNSFFSVFAKTLKFPNYFGYNWDAFYDCLADLSWLDNEPYIILYKNSHNFYSNNSEDWLIANNIMSDAISFWNEGENKNKMAIVFL